jgi:hypothetical protein
LPLSLVEVLEPCLNGIHEYIRSSFLSVDIIELLNAKSLETRLLDLERLITLRTIAASFQSQRIITLSALDRTYCSNL